jgi:saccharopine dehydrogenase-like NADP-dependent oxidoreductase
MKEALQLEDAVLIAGGYGVVGSQIARFVRERHPDLPIIIGGRNPDKAQSLARDLTNAESAKLDVEKPDPLEYFRGRLRAVIEVVNDPYDYLMLDAIRSGIAFVDITRWTERFRQARSIVTGESPSAPVMLASSWMGGLTPVIAVAAAHKLERVESIDISVLFSMKDKAGPNSIEYMDRLATPYKVMIDGKEQTVYPVTDPHTVTFPGGYRSKVYRFDSPEQVTLPEITGAKTVASRIGFDSALTTKALHLLVRLGIWKLIASDRFTKTRRSLLHHPGEGGPHEVAIELTGTDAKGKSLTVRASILDSVSQSHLTAAAVTMQLERILGLDGAPPPGPGLVFPESEPQLESGLQLLHAFGIEVTID